MSFHIEPEIMFVTSYWRAAEPPTSVAAAGAVRARSCRSRATRAFVAGASASRRGVAGRGGAWPRARDGSLRPRRLGLAPRDRGEECGAAVARGPRAGDADDLRVAGQAQ